MLYRRCVSTTLYSPQFERKIAQLCFPWLPLSAPSPPEPTLSQDQHQQVENQNPEHLDDDKLSAFLKRKIYNVRAAWRSCNVFTTSWIRAVQGQRVKRCPKEEEAGVKNLGDNKQAGRGRRVDWQRACFLCGATLGGSRPRSLGNCAPTNATRTNVELSNISLLQLKRLALFWQTIPTESSPLIFFFFLWVGDSHNGSADI